MRLSRLFIAHELVLQQAIAAPAGAAHYLRNVLRLKSGDEVLLFNGHEQIDYRSTVEMKGKSLTLTPVAAIEKPGESPIDIHLLLAIGKPEHIDFALQKATELGVTRISLFNSERTQTPIKGARLDKKMAHWRGVIISACEQCGRNRPTRLEFFNGLAQLLQAPLEGDRLILDFEGESWRPTAGQQNDNSPFHVLIGAEGGLSEMEIERAHAAGFNGIVLGPRVLRMETAAIAITTLIQQYFGDLK